MSLAQPSLESEQASNRLLIVDEDSQFALEAKELSTRLGCTVEIAADSQALERSLREFDPQVILLSLKIRDRDGVEMLRYLADQRCRAQIILIGGSDGRVLEATERLGQMRRLGLCGSFQKPIPATDLRKLLIRLLNLSPSITEEEVIEGVREGQFEPFFQPMIDLGPGGQIAGFEILARWHHPFHGKLKANEFIEVAERAGVLADLTLSLLDRALEESRPAVTEGSNVRLSVNVSTHSLTDLNLPDTVERIVAERGFENSSLTLELSESSMAADNAATLDILTRFRMKGFRLAMDNFGTGYSTLLEMVRLPFDEIKIDRRFVRRIGESRDSGVVVTSAITLAHGLGMTVCAEGVEDERALEFLRNAGCESAQGRALQAPVPGSEIANLLKQHRFAAKTTERVVSKELPRERFLGGDGGGPLLRPVQHGRPNGMDDSSGN